MVRVSVVIEDELLTAIDAEAANSYLDRSGLIQSALTSYLDVRRKQRDEDKVRGEMAEACHGMDALAEKLGAWDSLGVIRAFRASRVG